MSSARTAPLVIYMFIEVPKYKQEGRICSGCISMRPFVKQASTNPPRRDLDGDKYSLGFRLHGLDQQVDGFGSCFQCLALTNTPGLDCIDADPISTPSRRGGQGILTVEALPHRALMQLLVLMAKMDAVHLNVPIQVKVARDVGIGAGRRPGLAEPPPLQSDDVYLPTFSDVVGPRGKSQSLVVGILCSKWSRFRNAGEKVMCVYVKGGCEEGLARWPGIGSRGWPHCVSGWRT